MPTITVSPESDADSELLNTLSKKQRSYYAELNALRWKCFKNKEKVFEKHVQSIDSELDMQANVLPKTTKQILLNLNARDWSEHILQALKTGHLSRMKSSDIIATENIWFNKTAVAKPIGRFPSLCIHINDIQQTDETINIETNLKTLTLAIEKGSEKLNRLEDTTVYIYKTSNQYVIEPYSLSTTATHSTPKEEKPLSEDHQAILRTLSVAASVKAVTQVEPRKDNDSFPQLFDEIGLFWKQVDTNDEIVDTYLVGTQKRGKERIKQFIATNQQDRTIEDYFNLLEMPLKVAEYYFSDEWQQNNYDRYSAEEFALYAWLEGEINQSDMKYILYTPYRPLPDKKEIKLAIQTAKQFQEGLKILYNEAPSEKDYKKLLNYYDEHNKHNTLIRDKPILEVYNWLVFPKNKQLAEN